MPKTPKKKAEPDLIDQLLEQLEVQKPEDIENLHQQMLQRMVNRALEAEIDDHLGYQSGERSSHGQRNNTRNGKSSKTIQSRIGVLDIETPRDRDGSFEPQIVPKRARRLAGMEDKILALYAKGLSTREISDTIGELYGVEISHTIVSQVTDALLDEAKAWQNRPLDAVYPIVWLDGLSVKVHHGKQVVNKSAHVVMAVNLEGEKEVLGIWLAENEGAKFWLSCLTELRQRGVEDIYIACMDGLTGLPEAVNSAFPKTLTQLCMVHMVRASLRYVSSKDTKAVVAALKRIYTSSCSEEAETELDALETEWGATYRSVVRLWRENWDSVIPCFQFLPEIRKVIYTTNAIESLNSTMRRLTRNRKIFPNDDAARKSLYSSVQQASRKWGKLHGWKPALQSFQIMFGDDRVPLHRL